MTRLRALPVLSLLALVLLAACGGSTTSSSASSSSAATSAPATSASASASASGGGGEAASLTITTSQLPAGSETWTQVDDGTLTGSPVHKRVWQNGDQSQAIEIDLLVESSTAQASSDWSTWMSTVKGKTTNAQTQTCPSQLGSSCDEETGSTSDNKSEVTVAWQHGAVLTAVFLVNAQSTADQSYAEQVAAAQDGNLPS